MRFISRFFFVAVVILTGLSAWPLAWTPLAAQLEGFNTDMPKPKLTGTVWRGEINPLKTFGNITFTLSPFARFKGELPLNFTSNSDALHSAGRASLKGMQEVTAHGNLAWILPVDRRFAGVKGKFDLDLRTVDLDFKALDKGCLAAQGEFSTDVLLRNFALWQWSGPELRGPITCVDGALVTQLSGRETGQTIDINITMQADGIYQANISVYSDRAGAAAVLGLYGFSKSGSQFTLVETGKWW